jgi:hypothetical protein
MRGRIALLKHFVRNGGNLFGYLRFLSEDSYPTGTKGDLFTESNEQNEDPIWASRKALRYLRFLLFVFMRPKKV